MPNSTLSTRQPARFAPVPVFPFLLAPDRRNRHSAELRFSCGCAPVPSFPYPVFSVSPCGPPTLRSRPLSPSLASFAPSFFSSAISTVRTGQAPSRSSVPRARIIDENSGRRFAVSPCSLVRAKTQMQQLIGPPEPLFNALRCARATAKAAAPRNSI